MPWALIENLSLPVCANLFAVWFSAKISVADNTIDSSRKIRFIFLLYKFNNQMVVIFFIDKISVCKVTKNY